MGNPDISVDAKFVNQVAKFLIKKRVRVRFSTSGYNSIETAQNVLDDLDPKYIDYYSFSIDSLKKENEIILKGRIISLEEIAQTIRFCNDKGVQVKIQPTLWELNKDDYIDIINYFYDLGVKWFSFHAGSFETFDSEKPLLQHIDPWEWRDIQKTIGKICAEKGIKLHMPYLFLTEEEMKDYVKQYGEKCIPKNLLNTQIWLEKNYLRATHCPLLREHQLFEYDFSTGDKSKMDYSMSTEGYCPVAKKCFDNNLVKRSVEGKGHVFSSDTDEKLYTVCRFYNFRLDN